MLLLGFSIHAPIPWRFQNTKREALFSFGRHIVWSIFHIHYIENNSADILARAVTLDTNFIDYVLSVLFPLFEKIMYRTF